MKEKKETGISPWPWHVGYERIAVDEDDMLCIYDADNVKIADMVGYTDDDDAHAMLMSAAPELREELLKLMRRICNDCRLATKCMKKIDTPPCEIDGDCPKGLGDAKHVIAKSYGKEN